MDLEEILEETNCQILVTKQKVRIKKIKGFGFVIMTKEVYAAKLTNIKGKTLIDTRTFKQQPKDKNGFTQIEEPQYQEHETAEDAIRSIVKQMEQKDTILGRAIPKKIIYRGE